MRIVSFYLYLPENIFTGREEFPIFLSNLVENRRNRRFF